MPTPSRPRRPAAKPHPGRHPKRPRILLVHGVGEPVNADGSEDWATPWREKLAKILREDYQLTADIEAVDYHAVFHRNFQHQDLAEEEIIRALSSLGRSAGHPLGGKSDKDSVAGRWDSWNGGTGLTGLLRGTRGLNATVQTLYWTAGMIVRWADRPTLRAELRATIRAAIERHRPDIIVAHSLGSVIAYDLLRGAPELVEGRTFLSFGSQIGNAFVRGVFGGRLTGLPTACYWLHLYNPCDAVFTAEIRLHGTDTLHATEQVDGLPRRNFYQVYTPFDNPDPLDNTAVSTGEGTVGYLDTYEARQMAWPRALAFCAKEHHRIRRSLFRAVSRASETPNHRALLIGIDRYARPDIPELAGCANDTYLMSRILQEEGFPVENIRLLHNERATAAAVRDRLDWLLDDVDPGEFRLLFYSGHGHQLESYGPTEVADRLDECLCPHDYDYSVATAILDDHLYDLYAQLPYDSQFVVILDCCHAGGMARSGSARVRGLTSPSDVAHRGLYWQPGRDNAEAGHWARRSTGPGRPAGAGAPPAGASYDKFKVRATLPESAQPAAYVGKDGTLRRIFRGLSLRPSARGEKPSPTARKGATGPYLPVIFQACQEDDVALEHTDGYSSHGAFTFCFARALRQLGALSKAGDRRGASWETLLTHARIGLENLGYTQRPLLLAPSAQARISVTREGFGPEQKR